MKLNYELHEGSQAEKPAVVDTTSSATVVYLRRNIRQITRVDEMGEVTLWQYEEARISHSEYEQFLAGQIEELTPYTETKTAYYGDTEVTFYDIPSGNITVYVKDSEGNYPNYATSKKGNTITVTFDPVIHDTEITISIIGG